MKMCKPINPFVFVSFVLFTFCVFSSDCVKNVTILKCCKFDEILTFENKCVLSTDNAWNLRVFSPAKKIYLPKNIIPPNWHLKDGYKPENCIPTLLTANMQNHVHFQNGSLFIADHKDLVHPLNYCIDYNSVLVCLDPEKTQPQATSFIKINKCCGKNAIFSETNQTCIYLKGTDYTIDVGANKTLVGGFPRCNQNKVAILDKLQDVALQSNGSLWLEDSKTMLPPANYCLEHTLENTGRSASIIVCQEHLLDAVKNEPAGDLRFTLYPIGLALSAVFLAATLAAGSLLPASHHVLHWKCQTNHVACLLVGNILLCITQLSPGTTGIPCFLMAVFMHFVFLAAFFWLNTMCFNIWWTFRDLRPQSMEKSQERCRLRLYEIYAWGGPLIIAGTAAILDSIPDDPEYNLLKPGFGRKNCWFYGNMEGFIFFYGPMGLLLIINLALFALTARELTCGLWKRELVKSNTERAALGRVCVKLVVVMGVTWIADVISWLVGGPQELWYLTDLINCLQGVFIFIVVGCQPQVLSAVKRLWCLRKHQENGTAGTTNHHSSSSQGLPSMGDSVTNSVTNNTTKSSIPLETTC